MSFLPIFIPGNTPTATLVDYAIQSGLPSVTMPADIANNDVIIACTFASDNTITPSAAYGTGFTSISTGNTSFWASGYKARFCTSYKKANGSEGSTSIGGFMNSNRAEGAAVMVYRPDFDITTIASADKDSEGTPSTPTNQTITCSGGSGVTIGVGFYVDTSGTSTTNLTPDYDYKFPFETLFSGSYISMAAFAQPYGSGEDLTASMTDGGTNFLVSFYLNLT